MRPLVVFLLVSCLALPAFGQAKLGGIVEDASCSILVMELDGRALTGNDAGLPQLLTDPLVAEVAAASGCRVISEQEIASMMEFESAKAACAADSDSCLAEIGAAFGAERVLSGQIGRLGQDFLLSARLVDAQGAEVLGRAERQVSGGPEKLRVAVKELGRSLFDGAASPPSAPDPVTPTAAPVDEGGLSLMLLSGGAVTGVGVVLLVVGAGTAGASEVLLGDAGSKDKDEMLVLGYSGLAAAGVGALVSVGGAVLLGLGMLE